MRVLRFTALVGIAFTLPSCGAEDVRYLFRAAYEEARILARRQSIEEVLINSGTDDATRAKLELTLAARAFAADGIGLEIGGSYESVADVDQDQIVHVVSAAHRDRLQAYTWWFPIVGHVPYRGYFHRDAAVALARELENDGYDTYVRQALAFSTLGYFDDPLLSHLLRYDDVNLVETILHELLHGDIYLRGQAAFNESFANFVGYRGAIAFFTAHGNEEAVVRAGDRWADALQFGAALSTISAQLETAYADGVSEEQRQRLFDEARASHVAMAWRTGDFDRFATDPLNNAVLLAKQIYFERLELFETVLHRFDGDLRRTVAWLSQAARSGAEDPYGAIERALEMPAMTPRQ